MPGALAAATFRRRNAGAELRSSQPKVGPGETRNDAACGQGDIAAVIAIANTPNHFGDVLLREAGIGARIASFGAGVAGGDAFDDLPVVG